MRIRRDLNRDQFVAMAAAIALMVDAARIPARRFGRSSASCFSASGWPR
jgi:hypothetical protein